MYAWLGWSVLFLTLLLIQSGIRARAFLILLILLGVFEALYGLLQSLGGYDYTGEYFRGAGRTATGTLINRNHYAAVLNLTIRDLKILVWQEAVGLVANSWQFERRQNW